MSGSNQALLFSTLRYLGLVTEKGVPTQDLERLVNADEDERLEIWRRLVLRAYSNLFDSDFDLERTTTQELAEVFAREGVTSADTVRKCVTFFCFAAKDAGIKLSPHIKPYAGRRQSGRRARALVEGQKENMARPSSFVATDRNGSTDWEVLLSKFPDFDPSWPEELRKNWLDGFERLSRILKDATTVDDLTRLA